MGIVAGILFHAFTITCFTQKAEIQTEWFSHPKWQGKEWDGVTLFWAWPVTQLE